jgi:hypothetical protein
MTRTLRHALTATFLLVAPVPALAAPAETDHTSSTQVTIRFWDRAQVGGNIWDHAKTVIKGVFIPGGIQLVWSHCTIGIRPRVWLAQPSASCPFRIGIDSEVAVRADLMCEGMSSEPSVV